MPNSVLAQAGAGLPDNSPAARAAADGGNWVRSGLTAARGKPMKTAGARPAVFAALGG
ncbi:hypothetical protein MAFF211520_21270 [Ralstonia pseudosolanacearum]|nr:hypothetical protein A3768_2080 [Ralstonia solanacearum]BEU51835.1 hypothetical protein MAFF211520_21270 [Ralstonia pseudosolanacearum]BEU57080.1 hypothetical protein MAFF211521_21330 [Ralstonia pseudosolanacearum]BEU62238.1 hypothetical protein MAFF301524_20380 [Ralstonia pseudosolanacearum]